MLSLRFVCISHKCKMIYLDFWKCVDNSVSHLLEYCLFALNIILGKYQNQFIHKIYKDKGYLLKIKCLIKWGQKTGL